MLDGRVLGASQVEYKPFGKLPLKREAGQPISAPLEHSQLVLDLTGGHRHELTENMRSDPGVFDFVKWLRVGEPDAPVLEEAKARARKLFPAKPGWPETTLVISHARRVAVNAAANRALQPPGAKLLVLETGVEIALAPESQQQSPQNRAQNMLVWPGLRLIGGGGKIPKGVFVAVTEVEPEHVKLDNGLRLKQQELLRATRRHAVTYRVRLDLRPPSAPPVRGRVAGDQLRPA